jgi:hypothetical protein
MTDATYNSIASSPDGAPARQVSLLRLYALRAVYLLIAVAMGGQIWPLIFHHRPWELMHGVADCMLAAITALALLGVRYPLKMLPLLFVEMAWKSIWLLAVALPIWRSGQAFDADTAETVKACLMGVIFPLVIPWRYVFAHYVRAPGDRWR